MAIYICNKEKKYSKDKIKNFLKCIIAIYYYVYNDF